MAPKSRIAKGQEWEVCSHCTFRKVYVPAGEMTSHMEHHHGNECKQTPTSSGRRSGTPRKSADSTPNRKSLRTIERLTYGGFVREYILHGFATERRTKGDELARLPASIVDDIVLINPSTMSLCEMTIGSPVLVWTSSTSQSTDNLLPQARGTARYILQVAWPALCKTASTTICQTEVNLSPRTFGMLNVNSLNDVIQVHVQDYSPNQVLAASEILLGTRNDKSFFGTKEFADSFVHSFDGQHLVNGSTLIMHFYGQICELFVHSINKAKSNSKNNDHDTITLTDEMSELSLKEAVVNHGDGESVSKFQDIYESSSSTNCICEQTRPPHSDIEICYYVHSETRIRVTINEKLEERSEISDKPVVTFEDIGGLADQIKEIRRFINMSEADVQAFFSYGLQPPRGMVLFGPPGTGKTLIGQAIRHEIGDRFLFINGPEVFSKFVGETESKLRDLFAESAARAPSVIFIDEIDTLCAKRGSLSTHQEQRVVATLTTLMDNLPANFKDRVVVVGATSKLDDLDSSMRRPGRFDKEIEIGIPSPTDRRQIISRILKDARHNLSAEEIEKVASITHGFVGADLAALLSEAGMRRLKKVDRSSIAAAHILNLTYDDVISATGVIKPSALREILIQVPKVKWDDIGGQEVLKLKLKQAVEWPLKHPESFKRMGITPPKGALMYGPPGCSKTLIAKAVATESGLNFIAIKGPELFSKWVGESEKAIREVFRKARAAAPCVVFFDEIDALASERGTSSGGSQVGDRVLAQLLSEMDGLVKLQGVFILAATNRPDMIDKALLRPGRLDRIVYVPLPDKKTRREILAIQCKRTPVAKEVDLDVLANKSDNYSGAEVVAVCQEAALKAMEESLEAIEVCSRHFEHALEVVRPRTSAKMIRFYEEYNLRGTAKINALSNLTSEN